MRGAIRLRHAGRPGALLVRIAARDRARTARRLPLPGLLDSRCRLSKEMTRLLRTLLLVAALIFSQHAALLHGLAHAEHESRRLHEDEGAPALITVRRLCAFAPCPRWFAVASFAARSSRTSALAPHFALRESFRFALATLPNDVL
jgi:hypothetical protein